MNSAALVKPALADRFEAGEIDEEKFLGKAEILHQQPMAEERAVRVGHQAFVLAEADRLERRSRQADRADRRARRGITDHDAIQTAEQEFVQHVDQAALAVQIKPQLVDLQGLQVHIGRRTQLDADGAGADRQP